jgi:radical SAM protein with 4Fe4S-binding SPASM domain
MKENTKYTLALHWVIRYEENMNPQGLAYNIISDKKTAISKSLYYILYLFKYFALSIDELYEAINRQQTKETLIQTLFQNSALADILMESQTPNTENFTEPISDDFIKRFGIAMAAYPLEAEIHLTERCNLHCKHCCYNCSASSSLKEIESSYWINLFKQFEQNGIIKIAISGGEPFFYPHILNILKGLENRKFRIEFLTNGTLIKEQYLPYLSFPNMGFNISLDGSEKESHEYLRGKNTFEPTIRTIQMLSEIKARINISTTIHKQNISQIEKLICFAMQYNIYAINFILLDEIGRAKDNQDLHISLKDIEIAINTITHLQEKYKSEITITVLDPVNPQYKYLSKSLLSDNSKIYCSAATNRIAVAANGDVFPCVYGYDLQETIGGNITLQSINDIWRTEKWDIFRGKVFLKDLGQCKSCSLLNTCGLIVCRLKALIYSKDFYGMPYNCPKLLQKC